MQRGGEGRPFRSGQEARKGAARGEGGLPLQSVLSWGRRESTTTGEVKNRQRRIGALFTRSTLWVSLYLRPRGKGEKKRDRQGGQSRRIVYSGITSRKRLLRRRLDPVPVTLWS